MGVARSVLYVLHMVGVAAVLVGFAAQVSAGGRALAAPVLHGAATQLVTGFALVGVIEADDGDLNQTKITVKLAITVVLLALVLLNRGRDRVPDGVFFGALGLVIVNIGLAFGWN